MHVKKMLLMLQTYKSFSHNAENARKRGQNLTAGTGLKVVFGDKGSDATVGPAEGGKNRLAAWQTPFSMENADSDASYDKHSLTRGVVRAMTAARFTEARPTSPGRGE